MNSQLRNKRIELICIGIDAHMHTLTVTHRVLHICVGSVRDVISSVISCIRIDCLLFSIILSRW